MKYTKVHQNKWSRFKKDVIKKKKKLHDGKPHNQTPDLDNFLKAWKDSVFKEDSVVWRVHACKLWTSGPGHIIVRDL